MLNELDNGGKVDIREVINIPDTDEDIVTACDKLLVSLENAEKNARKMLYLIKSMDRKFNMKATL
jgi:hypothetical protein